MSITLRLLATLLLILPLTPVASVSAEDLRESKSLSEQDYQDYLLERPGGDEIAAAFDQLSEPDKVRFMEYMNDERLAKGLMGSLITGEADAELSDPGIEVTIDRKTLNEPSAQHVESGDTSSNSSARGARTVQGTRSVSILGVTVTSITTWLSYNYSGSSVTSVNSAGSRHTNYVPFNRFTLTTRAPWVSSNRARAATDWQGETCALIVAGCISQGATQNVSATAAGSVSTWMSG